MGVNIDCRQNDQGVRCKDKRVKAIIASCPFCGGVAREHPYSQWRWKFYAVYHSNDCWFATKKAIKGGYNFTPIPKRGNDRKNWDHRHNVSDMPSRQNGGKQRQIAGNFYDLDSDY